MQSESLVDTIEDEGIESLQQPNEVVADMSEGETGCPPRLLRDAQQELNPMATSNQPESVGDTSGKPITSKDALCFPLKKKKKKQHHEARVIPLSIVPILRLPSPPTTSESEEQVKARRRKNSFLASAYREPAWYEDVFDKATIENTRMNLGSLTLGGESKTEKAAILKRINHAAKVELREAGTAKVEASNPSTNSKIRWGETTVGFTKFTRDSVVAGAAAPPELGHKRDANE